MARILRMFRKKALQVAPEPEGSSCHFPQEQRGPSIPAGGEAAPGQARRWKCPAFWQRKPARGAGSSGPSGAGPGCGWAGWLWGFLCGKHQPQEPSPDFQQEASSCPITEDLPASPGQEVEDPCPSPSSSWDSGSREADGRCCFVPASAQGHARAPGCHAGEPAGRVPRQTPLQLEAINFWIMSRMSQERDRAIRSSTALLRFTITLPEFENSAEFPRIGHHVAQLGLFVSDPAKDISQWAREGIYQLYQLLLHKRVWIPLGRSPGAVDTRPSY
ncbi:unnamed protein product [Caretta caretta]